VVTASIGLTVVTALKGKPWTALLSAPLWGLGLVGAVRLARPGSPWARRYYRAGSAKDRRAARRATSWDRAAELVLDAIGGRFGDAPGPDPRDPPPGRDQPG
jgi:hypothetical protein